MFIAYGPRQGSSLTASTTATKLGLVDPPQRQGIQNERAGRQDDKINRISFQGLRVSRCLNLTRSR
jgi:hypothetical protein